MSLHGEVAAKEGSCLDDTLHRENRRFLLHCISVRGLGLDAGRRILSLSLSRRAERSMHFYVAGLAWVLPLPLPHFPPAPPLSSPHVFAAGGDGRPALISPPAASAAADALLLLDALSRTSASAAARVARATRGRRGGHRHHCLGPRGPSSLLLAFHALNVGRGGQQHTDRMPSG